MADDFPSIAIDPSGGSAPRPAGPVDVALCAAAIEAYRAQRAADAARFFRTAEHGRPRPGATGGHRITL